MLWLGGIMSKAKATWDTTVLLEKRASLGQEPFYRLGEVWLIVKWIEQQFVLVVHYRRTTDSGHCLRFHDLQFSVTTVLSSRNTCDKLMIVARVTFTLTPLMLRHSFNQSLINWHSSFAAGFDFTLMSLILKSAWNCWKFLRSRVGASLFY